MLRCPCEHDHADSPEPFFAPMHTQQHWGPWHVSLLCGKNQSHGFHSHHPHEEQTPQSLYLCHFSVWMNRELKVHVVHGAVILVSQSHFGHYPKMENVCGWWLGVAAQIQHLIDWLNLVYVVLHCFLYATSDKCFECVTVIWLSCCFICCLGFSVTEPILRFLLSHPCTSHLTHTHTHTLSTLLKTLMLFITAQVFCSLWQCLFTNRPTDPHPSSSSSSSSTTNIILIPFWSTAFPLRLFDWE